jgi:hypothetical protein
MPATLGPADHFPVPSSSWLVDGTLITGPTPQVMTRAATGDANALSVMSPAPDTAGSPCPGDGMLALGTMGRATRFRPRPSGRRTTGWSFETNIAS